MKKGSPGRIPTGPTPGGCAVPACAGADTDSVGAGLLARTVANTPPNEPGIRGLVR